MRISRSSVRKVSTRRAHRPDQRVYRTMRLSRKRVGSTGWVAVAVGAVVGVVAVVVWALGR